jgi:hypothetical protein
LGIKNYTILVVILGLLEIGLMYYKNSLVPIPYFFAGVSIFTIVLLSFAIYMYFYYSLISRAVDLGCDDKYTFGTEITYVEDN